MRRTFVITVTVPARLAAVSEEEIAAVIRDAVDYHTDLVARVSPIELTREQMGAGKQ
jgi:hypothetical protein